MTQCGYGKEKPHRVTRIQLVLDKEYGYLINVLQGDYEIIDYELGGSENAIVIIQSE